MSQVTIEHPLAWDRTKSTRSAILDFCGTVLAVALFLAPFFLIVGWIVMLDANSPDVPEPSWGQSVIDFTQFVVLFPLGYWLRDEHTTLGDFGFLGGPLNGIFWAFLGVLSTRVAKWLWQSGRNTFSAVDGKRGV